MSKIKVKLNEEPTISLIGGYALVLNPIIDNRIVQDKTFAGRLLSFAQDVQCADACSQDEKDSMISYAKQLLHFQIQTATDQDELNYLERVNAKNKIK